MSLKPLIKWMMKEQARKLKEELKEEETIIKAILRSNEEKDNE